MKMQREGISIVQLGVGEPDFDAPPDAVAATVASLQAGQTHYTDSRGLHALREAISEDCARRRGIQVTPDQVVVTSGTSPAILLCLQLLIEPGDEVIMATPHYPCYPNMVVACGGRPVLVPTHADNGFLIDVDEVRRRMTKQTRAIIVASPANPTGAVQPKDVIEGLSALGVPILSDEIYDQLLYDGATVHSPLGLAEECYVLDGFSKRYAMTGFRLGYVIAPPRSVRRLQSMQQSFFISAAEFVQRGGIAALEYGQAHVEDMTREYAQRRRIVLGGLREMGFTIPVDPPGAFYILADARAYGSDSLDLAFRILDKAHVALGPGRDFGLSAEGFLRFSFATNRDEIVDGLSRLKAALPSLRRDA